MTPLLPAVAGALIVAGVIGVAVGLRRSPVRPTRPKQLTSGRRRRWALARRTQLLLVAGLVVGVVTALVTGWLIAAVAVPAAVAGLPALLAAPGRGQVDRLEAMEEWTRSLSGVLTVGVGLEEALVATLRSTPEPIRPEVAQLVARLRARWSTEDAIRAFADRLDDATGDLIAANLILGARRRGTGLASVLEGLAESVAADVRTRRAIEADRARPRTTARWVTIITVGVLVVLALTGRYIAPYGTPLGQLLLTALLTLYAVTLVWMRRMVAGKPLPRFIGATVRGERGQP